MAKIHFKENGSKGVESSKDGAQEAKEPTIKELGAAINMMDCLSQDGFSQISAIAKLALKSLESPDGHRHISDVFSALEAIVSKADDVQNIINSEAECVGFQYQDAPLWNCWSAASEYRKSLNEEQA
jgi:hypothetical protein